MTASNNRNVLTGIGDVLSRHHSDAVWVRFQDFEKVERYAAQLEALTEKDTPERHLWVQADLIDSVETFAEKLAEAEVKKSEWNERWALISRIIDLPQHELDYLGWALDAIEQDYGSGTPEEEFVTQILMLYGIRHLEPVTLNNVIDDLSSNLRSIAQDAAYFAKRFPNGYSAEDNQWPTLETEEVAAHA